MTLRTSPAHKFPNHYPQLSTETSLDLYLANFDMCHPEHTMISGKDLPPDDVPVMLTANGSFVCIVRPNTPPASEGNTVTASMHHPYRTLCAT